MEHHRVESVLPGGGVAAGGAAELSGRNTPTKSTSLFYCVERLPLAPPTRSQPLTPPRAPHPLTISGSARGDRGSSRSRGSSWSSSRIEDAGCSSECHTDHGSGRVLGPLPVPGGFAAQSHQGPPAGVSVLDRGGSFGAAEVLLQKEQSELFVRDMQKFG